MLLQNKPNGENRVNVNIKMIQTGLITLYTPVRAYIKYKIVYLIVEFHVTKIILIDTPYASKINTARKIHDKHLERSMKHSSLCVYFSLYTE